MCEAAAGGRWDLTDRARGVLVADKQSKGESGRVRMGDESRGNPFVLTEQEEWGRDVERGEGGRRERERERERERTRKGAKSNGLVQTRKNSMLLRALGAQPRRRKPAFVTHDNEASLCITYISKVGSAYYAYI